MRKKRQIRPQSDAQIEKAVEDALFYDPRVSAFDIRVDVDERDVTLTGVVDNLKAKQSAERDARNTAGVWRVENYLKVRSVSPPSDSEIAEAIRNALQQDTSLDRFEFTVSVVNQQAYLYGTVDSHYDKMRAENVASRVAGVIEISNFINVSRTWEWKSDADIKADVEDELFWSPYVDSEDINIEVEDGEAILTGVATDWAEADTAVGNAFEGGARSVRARLDLADGSKYTRYYAHDYEYYWYDHFYEDSYY
jgi:osmotically-inducible protein OsmY